MTPMPPEAAPNSRNTTRALRAKTDASATRSAAVAGKKIISPIRSQLQESEEEYLSYYKKQASVEEEEEDGSRRVTKSNSDLARMILFETQQMMPSPGTTYFQLSVQSDRVVLRDWPRQRFSQRWSRNGLLNPGQQITTLKEFVDGEWKEELISVFGKEIYEKALSITRDEIQKQT